MKTVWAAVAAAALTIGLAGAPPAHANVKGCIDQYWLYNLRGSTRIICDGPIRPDGSWERARAFIAPSFIRTSCYGYYSVTCDTRMVPELDVRDYYVVTPDTIPAGEPGWIA